MWLAIGLAAAGVVAIILEVFVPAAGIIGIAGVGSIIASVVIAYQRLGNLIGSIHLAVVLVLVFVWVIWVSLGTLRAWQDGQVGVFDLAWGALRASIVLLVLGCYLR